MSFFQVSQCEAGEEGEKLFYIRGGYTSPTAHAYELRHVPVLLTITCSLRVKPQVQGHVRLYLLRLKLGHARQMKFVVRLEFFLLQNFNYSCLPQAPLRCQIKALGTYLTVLPRERRRVVGN